MLLGPLQGSLYVPALVRSNLSAASPMSLESQARGLRCPARTGTRGPQGVGHEDFTGSADVVRAGSGLIRPAADARNAETINERHAEASSGRCTEASAAGLEVGLGRQRLRDED